MNHGYEAFRDDLIERMSADAVHYPEIYWAAKEHFPDLSDHERLELIVRAIAELVDGNTAKVGLLEDAGGVLDVTPWPERGADLRLRIQADVQACPIPPRLGDGFWISTP